MKVFLGWSGPRSQKVATVLRHWLPEVLPGAKPWMSEQDISKGTRWSSELWRNLETAAFGILSLVPGMASSPWVLFEAGVLAGANARDRVAPLLVGISLDEVPSPLREFQCATRRKADVLKLIWRINDLHPGSESDEVLTKRFDDTWPRTRDLLRSIERLEPDTRPLTQIRQGSTQKAPPFKLDSLSGKILLLLAHSIHDSEPAYGLHLQTRKPERLIKLRMLDLMQRGLVRATSTHLDTAYFAITEKGLRLVDAAGGFE